MPTTKLQYQDYTASLATPKGRWLWTMRLDVSQATPRYEVRDIRSPYGILRDSIPIPGDVIQAMADQMGELAQSFAPHMLVSPTSLTITLDEGIGFGPDQPLLLTNDGVFGSLLDATLATSAPWLQTTPSRVSGLGAGEAGTVQVRASSFDLVAADSPYAATITIQAQGATNGPLTVPVTVVVRPKAHIQVLPSSLAFFVVRPLSGPFPTIPDQTFQVINTGPPGSVLSYRIQKLLGCTPWLSVITPSQGTLAAAGSQLITVRVVPPPSTLSGTYVETIRVSGYSDNTYQDVSVTFTVT